MADQDMTTVVVDSVTSKEGESGGKPWRKWTLKDGNGQFYSTFDAKLADVLTKLEGKKAEIVWKRSGSNGQFKDLVSAEEVPEKPTISARSDDGGADWDLIGLRKTRSILWVAYLQSPMAAGVVAAGSEAMPINHRVYQFGAELLAMIEKDIYLREVAQEDADIPFGDE